MTPADVKFGWPPKTVAEAELSVIEHHKTELAEAETKLEQLRKSLQARLDNVRLAAECVAELRKAGFGVPIPYYTWMSLRVKLSDLPRLRPVTGRLRLIAKTAAGDWDKQDAGFTGDCIMYHLRCEKYPMLGITYLKQVQEGDRCRIIRETRTEASVVCSPLRSA